MTPLFKLFWQTPSMVYLTDVATVIHLLALTTAFFGVFKADSIALRWVKQPLDSKDIKTLERNHSLIIIAQVFLWSSGIALVYGLTQFDLASFSPKLIGKLAVVSILSLTALIMSFSVMRIIQNRAQTAIFSCLSFKEQLVLSVSFALSITSWILGFLLGALQTTKVAGADAIISLLVLSYSISLTVAIAVPIVNRSVLRLKHT